MKRYPMRAERASALHPLGAIGDPPFAALIVDPVHQRRGDRDRSPAPRSPVVRCPRHHRRTGSLRQGSRLSIACLDGACVELAIGPKKTRPYRPQNNGKIERFHRTLAEGWAFARHYNSEAAHRATLQAWLHHYNHHRPHTGIGKLPPISRLTNLPGQYT